MRAKAGWGGIRKLMELSRQGMIVMWLGKQLQGWWDVVRVGLTFASRMVNFGYWLSELDKTE